MRRRFTLLAVPAAALAFSVGGSTAHAVGTTLYVTTTGVDNAACSQVAPCKTLQFAVDKAPNGATVQVAAGTYNQSVNVTKPLTLAGAGQSPTTGTIIDGHGIDHGALGYYGVVGIDNTNGSAGAINVHGFYIHNGFVTPAEYTPGLESPTDIFVADQNAGDTVSISHVRLGAAQDEATYAGIGLDTLNAQPPITFQSSMVTGVFQGALIEGGGFNASKSTDTIRGNTFTALAPCLATTPCGSGTTYSPEGVFVLSDQPGRATDNVSGNTFKNYAGDGIAVDAGYAGGNCAPPNGPCTGNVTLMANGNSFALGGASGAAAIDLHALSGNSLTASLTNNHGTVKSPTQPIIIKSDGGGFVNVTESNDDIDQV